MFRTVILVAVALIGGQAQAANKQSLMEDAKTLASSCVSIVQPISSVIENTNQTVKHGFARFKPPRWDLVQARRISTGFIIGYSRLDDLTNKKVSFRVEFKTIPNTEQASTCGPNRLLLSRVLIDDGEETQTLSGGDAFLILQRIN